MSPTERKLELCKCRYLKKYFAAIAGKILLTFTSGITFLFCHLKVIRDWNILPVVVCRKTDSWCAQSLYIYMREGGDMERLGHMISLKSSRRGELTPFPRPNTFINELKIKIKYRCVSFIWAKQVELINLMHVCSVKLRSHALIFFLYFYKQLIL